MWRSRLSHVVVAICAIVPAMADHLFAREIEGGNTTFGPLPAESYFREPTAANLLHSHIALMSLSWIGAFPVYLVLDLARSNLAYPAQILCLGLHTIGIIFGLAYNSQTPDLYPGNTHHNLGWILTGIAIFQFVFRISRSFARSKSRKTRSGENGERTPFIPISEARTSFNNSTCHEDVEAVSPRLSICCGEDGTSSNGTDSETLFDVPLPRRRSSIARRYGQPMSWMRRWGNVVGSNRLVPVLDIISTIFNVVLAILVLVAICTGIVTMAGIFHGKHIFNGLAHFIKGGVFFIYGLVTFSRWIGCFAHLGWAWNLKLTPTPQSQNWKNSITMEGVECFLILAYGISNVFLEHLSAWGGEWSPQDFEHVAISLLFIGGGLCGMMVETTTFRASPDAQSPPHSRIQESKQTLQPGYSLNPLPTLILLILGTVLAGHHQGSIEATMMHKWVGNFLAGAAAARCVTYLLIYISPPKTIEATRLPSEIVVGFYLMGGGVMLMASNRDTVDAVIANGLNAMLVATLGMGCVAALMAWGMGLFVLSWWAGRREERWRLRKGGS
ncbi:related to YTP1 [Phialocephala subalpina]|uniref:Related to YTP1 n=1 Tax=Phialocephala subalpina TaxID=576137 RepID=A0A1L7X9V2_9HELO|nr:related to YTP1 [Phialocephala subalpina]